MNIWQTAVSMAEQTPADRNRYVDFLRAVSILVVIMGHWLIATAWWVDGELVTGHLVAAQPELQWLTWIFQVMPIFFIVGGYANAVSLESADRKGTTYAQWLNARINRLLTPLLVLLVAWAVISFGLQFAGVTDATVQYLSRSALVPTWFLAIYTMVVILAPAAYRLWQKLG
ncbi:MAG: acyltransferase family protein, partial [Pseudomonadota bacterium]